MKKLIMTLTMVLLVMSLSVPMFAAADGDSWGKVPATPDKIDIDAEMDPIYADEVVVLGKVVALLRQY